MITNKEVELTKLSPTKKDFYQIWNELLDTAGKISERWDPASTNESDPGIVLLKVLTAIADKLNYNIDKNILELFMPSAAQEESMRKLCEMMGYNIKYYQSATTKVTVSYVGQKDANGNIATVSAESTDGKVTAWTGDSIIIPQFSVVKNNDEDVNYFTLEPITFYDNITTATVNCLEGQLVACEEDSDNIISIKHLDDNNRYYLPETQIAENGFFVYNINDSSLSDRWEQVDNLNIQQLKKACYKFGYDSVKNLPYLQFPDDISAIIEDGLLIYYTRTNGINGNISQQTLSQIEVPTSTSTAETNEISQNPWDYFTKDDFTAINYSAAVNGKNKETINQAYNNYKKTIGTFDTLVTCRDYMNKIYQLVSEEDNTTPLVSNIIATDLRTDLNRSYTLCSFNEYGISYENVAIKDGEQDLINHFDLILYPFMYTSLPTIKEYKKSYTYSAQEYNHILDGINKNKTLSHNIILPDTNDIVCIKNYYTIKADIITTKKVNSVEEASILSNVYSAICSEFNMRNLDFGEELLLDNVIECIKNADTRIKMVNCYISDINTKLALVNNDDEFSYVDNKNLYLKLIARNILAGRVPLFRYDTEFSTSFNEQKYSTIGLYETIDEKDPCEAELFEDLPENIVAIKSSCKVKVSEPLSANQVVQFRAPNFKTIFTYPAYVNYYAKLNTIGDPAIAAKFKTVSEIFDNSGKVLDKLVEAVDTEHKLVEYDSAKEKNITKYAPFIFKYKNDKYVQATEEEIAIGEDIYYINIDDEETFAIFYKFITEHIYCEGTGTIVSYNYYSHIITDEQDDDEDAIEIPDNKDFVFIENLYKRGGFTADKAGALIDDKGMKYKKVTTFVSVAGGSITKYSDCYYIQYPTFDDSSNLKQDGLGQNATEAGIKANSEYCLGHGEYIWFNYTESEQEQNKKYEEGTIIRPNFNLMDSDWTHKNLKRSWTKSQMAGLNAPNPSLPAMSLGAQEQIEIRDLNKVIVDEQAYVYWNLQGDNVENLYAKLKNTKAYTLETDEYFYWADKNKTSFAWYGPGTELSIPEPRVIKNLTNTKINIEDALTYGISQIPWISVNFTSNNPLTITEYQYINLTEFDELVDIEPVDKTQANIEYLDENELEVLDASYCIKNSATDKGEYETLPIIAGMPGEYIWKVSTKLNINVGPETPQILNENDEIAIYTSAEEKAEPALILKPLYKKTTINEKTLTEVIPLAIKANYKIQTSSSKVDTDFKITDEDGEEIKLKVFKLKVFKQDSEINNWNLNNFSDNYTKVLSKDLFYIDPTRSEEEGYVDSPEPLPLHINIGDSQFGLMMIYVAGLADNIKYEKAPYLESTAALKIYLRADDEENPWWKGWKATNKYYLKPGMNIIKFDNSTDLKLYGDTDIVETEDGIVHLHRASILFDKLALINKTNIDNSGFNRELLGLDKLGVDSLSLKAQIISMLNGQEKQFYFNCPISNDIAININKDETLLDYNIWYDVNNINNQFVISELDSNTFKDNINIIKSSKL